jgi:hypothetical protein
MFADVSQAGQIVDGEVHDRFLTLIVSGTPAGASEGRSDYWSISIEQAIELGEKLLIEAGRARGMTRPFLGDPTHLQLAPGAQSPVIPDEVLKRIAASVQDINAGS